MTEELTTADRIAIFRYLEKVHNLRIPPPDLYNPGVQQLFMKVHERNMCAVRARRRLWLTRQVCEELLEDLRATEVFDPNRDIGFVTDPRQSVAELNALDAEIGEMVKALREPNHDG